MREVVDGLLDRYRDGMRAGPRFWLTLADVFGVLDRERLVEALQKALREVARDPAHPLRQQIAEAIAELPKRLRTDDALIARVEALKTEALASPAVAGLLEDAATALRQALGADVAAADSEIVGWVADRLDRARQPRSAPTSERGRKRASSSSSSATTASSPASSRTACGRSGPRAPCGSSRSTRATISSTSA
jgi:uncharacterized membrane-anchored protein YjiN (DUF445 family)